MAYVTTSEAERRRIERAYGKGFAGRVTGSVGRNLLPAYGATGYETPVPPPPEENPLLASPGPDFGLARMPVENAIQRWSRPPADMSVRGASGLTPGQQFQAVTGRIDATAYQSPRDTTPSATQVQPSMGFGRTDSDAWSQTFQAGMPAPARAIRPQGGFSWENRRSFAGTEPTSRYDAAVAAGGRLQTRPEFTEADAKKRLDVLQYNENGSLASPALRRRVASYRGWTPY